MWLLSEFVEAGESGAEGEEGVEMAGIAFVVNDQAPVSGQQCDGSLDHPAVFDEVLQSWAPLGRRGLVTRGVTVWSCPSCSPLHPTAPSAGSGARPDVCDVVGDLVLVLSRDTREVVAGFGNSVIPVFASRS